jgi:hypothetical protein
MEDRDLVPANNHLGKIRDMILNGVLVIGNGESKRVGEVEVGVGKGIEIITEVNDDTPS